MILNMPGKRPESLKELLRYVYQLEEQLRFILGNIDGADITPGTVNAEQLAAGSITVDKISPGIGGELDISSNKSITLTAKKLEETNGSITQMKVETDKIISRVTKTEETTTGLGTRVITAETALLQQAEKIALKVNVGDAVETLKNTAMTLNGNGIEMTTTGYFKLYANDGKKSSIKLGGDDQGANFSVDETGKMGAVEGAFTKNLTVDNKPVWTRGSIIVQPDRPEDVHDVIWICPQNGAEQVIYSALNETQGYFDYGIGKEYTLKPKNADVLTSGGSYTYTMTMQIGRGESPRTAENYTMEAVLTTSAGSVTMTSDSFKLGNWGYAQVTLKGTNTENLFGASENEVTVKIKAKCSETPYGNTFLFVSRNTNIELTIKNTAAAAGGDQTCTIYYIP